MGEWNRYTAQTKIEDLSRLCRANYQIDPEFYSKYDVKRGLRDINGKGVCAGLTNISQIIPGTEENGETKLGEGQLLFRGYHIEDLVNGFISDNRFGYEETVYLLLFGQLPNRQELEDFSALMRSCRTLPPSFTRDVIMKSPSEDMMNTLAKSVLALYSYDHNPNDTSIANVLRQCIQLIAQFPSIAVYGYQAYSHYQNGNSLFIHPPVPELSSAENLLHKLRPDSSYTELEVEDAFEVTVSDAVDVVTVTVGENIMPKVVVEVVENTLKIHLKGINHSNYGSDMKWTMPWGTELASDIYMTSRRGYSQKDMNTDELLWNASVSHSFLKGNALTIKGEVYDILGQKTNVSRNISADSFRDSRTNGIYQYGLVSLIYRFSVFAGKNTMGTKDERREGDRRPGW